MPAAPVGSGRAGRSAGLVIPGMIALETTMNFLTVMATAVMAVSASIQAVRHGFDPFGAVVLAIVTAVGGGTLRDLLIGAFPVFWIRDLTFLATAVPVGFVTYLFAKNLKAGNGRRLRLLLYFDAVGLALFSLIGVQVAIMNGTSAPIAVVLGCITGVAGGMFRDVLCGLTPSILKEDLYATISLVGGGLYLALQYFLSEETSIISAFLAMTAARIWVVLRSRPKDRFM